MVYEKERNYEEAKKRYYKVFHSQTTNLKAYRASFEGIIKYERKKGNFQLLESLYEDYQKHIKNVNNSRNIKPEKELTKSSPKEELTKAFSKEEYIQFTESFGFCQQFNLIYRTDFNKNIEKGNKGFVGAVINNDYSRYYVCNILSMELMTPVFTWQKDNNPLYVKSYMKGLCNLSINLDYMKKEKDKVFIEKTKEYFIGRVINFHKIYPEIAKKYDINLILDKNNLDKSLKDSCSEFN